MMRCGFAKFRKTIEQSEPFYNGLGLGVEGETRECQPKLALKIN
jgi:hypothetical protein